jgi:hypothetical protein
MSSTVISHAFVIPDQNFQDWLAVLRPYLTAFPRVAVVRGPGGNNLNRYRDVSAVAAPATWFQGDPVAHIRRVYPLVVRVDVLAAATPAALAPLLAARIAANDRFGERAPTTGHIHDRFVLAWPLGLRPMRIVTPFPVGAGAAAQEPGLVLAARAGVPVLAPVGGTVTRQWTSAAPDARGLRHVIELTARHEGRTYVVTLAGVVDLTRPVGAAVEVGEALGNAAGDTLRMIVQAPGQGSTIGGVPAVIDPSPLLYIAELRLRPTANRLRLRTLPQADSDIIGFVDAWDRLETNERHARVLTRVGQAGQWLKLRTPDGRDGYCAAWFLEAITKSDGSAFAGVNPVGINLDRLHPLGQPEPNALGTLGWVRYAYNVSNNRGSQDIAAAYARYLPVAQRYAGAGMKVCFTITHQTYGEGRNEFWPWRDMTAERWEQLIVRLADMVSQIAAQWAGQGLVHVWQIWNEQDAPPDAQASVAMPAAIYSRMLAALIPAIRAVDPTVTIISGGHTGGPGRGAPYARQAIAALPDDVHLDGIAFHPYGRWIEPHPLYAPFGMIDESIRAYGEVLPGVPLWITEWGLLDQMNLPPAEVADFAIRFIQRLKAQYAREVAAMIWYAWAESMHNGYGIVDAQGRPRPPLTEAFVNA